MNNVERERWFEFSRAHRNCKPYPWRKKASLYYKCYPCGIGTAIVACCPNCGTEKDITDIDSW